MKYIFTTILAFFLAFKGYNQAGFSQNAKDYIETSSSKKVNDKDVDVILADPNLKGSPYANQNFIKGEIIDKSIEKKIDVYLRYRIIDDVIQVKSNSTNNDIYILSRSTKNEALIGESLYLFLENYPIQMNGTSNGYALVLNNRNKSAILLKRQVQEYIASKEAQNSYSSNTPAKLNTSIYYFIKTNDEIIQIEPHKKRAADAFPDHKKELENYIKDKKLKFRGDDEEKDLIELVEYYNTL